MPGPQADRRRRAVRCVRLHLLAGILQQAREDDVVEDLDHRPSYLLGDLLALDLFLFDGFDATITHEVIVAGVDDDDVIRHAGEEIFR